MYNYLHNHTVIKAAYNVWHYIYATILHISALKKVCLKKMKDKEKISNYFLVTGRHKEDCLQSGFFPSSLLEPELKSASC